MRVVAVSWVAAIAACHVTSQTEVTRPGKTERITHPEGALARRPTLVLADDGRLRFVEPLECPTEEVVTEQRALERERGPNLATFVVGVIATAAGGIAIVRGVTDEDGAGNPITYAGAAGLAVGLPLAIGPWIGNRTELRDITAANTPPVRRPGPAVPCGERAFAGTHATLAIRGIEVFGTVARDGTFAISPYQLVDAFAVPTAPVNVSGRVEAATGARTVDIVLEPRALATHAKTFLARADFDTKIEPMRVVPNVVPGTLRASLTALADGTHAARIVLAVTNEGPGPAYALRGHVAAPGTPALDGRILYFGHVAKKATVTRELLVPVSPAAAEQIKNATIELALELRDAHGTAPTTPVKFRGPILVDAPR